MKWLKDINNREIRFTSEREKHIEQVHPEMTDSIERIRETILNPEIIVRSVSDEESQLFYKHYKITKVGAKYLCVVVKENRKDAFILTAYFTDIIKKGKTLWKKK